MRGRRPRADHRAPAPLQAQALEGRRRRSSRPRGSRSSHDPAGIDARGRGQLGAKGRLHPRPRRHAPQVRLHRRHHRGVGQGRDPERAREEGRGRRRWWCARRVRARTARTSASTTNAAVLVDNAREPIGTRIFGPVARELAAALHEDHLAGARGPAMVPPTSRTLPDGRTRPALQGVRLLNVHQVPTLDQDRR